MIQQLKETHKHHSQDKESKYIFRSRTQDENSALNPGTSRSKLKHNLILIHNKLDLRDKLLNDENKQLSKMRASMKHNTDVSIVMPNISMINRGRFGLFTKGSHIISILSKEDSKISEKSDIKGLCSLSIKREVVKAAKKLLLPEFVTIQTLLEISNDLQKAQAIYKQLTTSDKNDFDDFFKKRQIKTKRGIFKKTKFVILIEIDGFLAKTVNSTLEVNYSGIDLLKRYQNKFCFVAYSRQTEA